MTVLLTGSAGFIGSHLLDALRIKEETIIYMDKKDGGSTTNFDLLENAVTQYSPDIIVHLGANCSSQISLREPRLDFTDNVVGTFNICEVSRLHGNIPIIFNSTMKIYSGDDGKVPPYGFSKLVGEEYLYFYHNLYGVPFIINRPSSVYGPRQDGSEDGGWFTWFIRASLTNQLITIYGDGTQSRDVLYIDDHIELLLDQVYNFDLYANQDFDSGGGEENEVSLHELLAVLEYHNVAYTDPWPGDVKRFVCDNVEVSAVNGWKPKVSWIDGLELTKKYFL